MWWKCSSENLFFKETSEYNNWMLTAVQGPPTMLSKRTFFSRPNHCRGTSGRIGRLDGQRARDRSGDAYSRQQCGYRLRTLPSHHDCGGCCNPARSSAVHDPTSRFFQRRRRSISAHADQSGGTAGVCRSLVTSPDYSAEPEIFPSGKHATYQEGMIPVDEFRPVPSHEIFIFQWLR